MAYLEKVDGFRAVFKRREIGCHAIRWLDKDDFRLFSHQIPARKLFAPHLSGDCWELDPASLPPDLLTVQILQILGVLSSTSTLLTWRHAEFGKFQAAKLLQLPTILHGARLQPVRDTREKQIQLWKELIVEFCRSQKIFIIILEEDFPLFSNPTIERTLSHEAREAFLSALVAEGRAEWMDKGHKRCLILWHRIQDWADIIISFAKDNGLEDSVMTVEELRSGIESQGTELHGIDRTVLMRALKVLEYKGKLAIFKGTSTDDDGVKFSV